MKNKEAVIKKIKNGLKVAVAATLISLSLTSCGVIKTQEFTSQEEIVENAEALDCDMSYMMKRDGDFVRMQHNNGEPIYVCFDESYPDDLKEKSKQSLDYVFGIVNKINDKYHYEVVDKEEFEKMGNKTKIYYTFGEHITDHGTHQSVAQGHLESHAAWYNFVTGNPVCLYYELNLNKEQSEKTDDKNLLNTLNHELLHAFGLGDVYTTKALQTTTKFYGNTFMNSNIDIDIITPNDLGCLIALYADEDCDVSKMKQELEKYEIKFNKYFAEKCKEKLVTDEDVVDENFIWFGGVVRNFEDGSSVGTDYKLQVENGYYTLQIKDAVTGKQLDLATGEATLQNGVMVLKNVELNKGLYPHNVEDCYEGGFVQDLAVLSKDGVISLYNFTSNDFLYGGYLSLEKGLTQ